VAAHVFGALADLDVKQGHIKQAMVHWRRAVAAIQEQQTTDSLALPVIGWVYIRMGEILYEWNDLAQAWDYLSRGLERAELGGDVQARIAGQLMAARLKLTAGDIDAADEYLERARPLIEHAPFPDWVGRFGRFQLEFWLAQDRLRAAVHWADDMLQNELLADRAQNEEAQLAMARVLVTKGDASSVERALALLEGLLPAAEAEGRVGVTIETLALRALAQWRRGDRTTAMTSLEHALRLAEPEGYVRLFADLGLPMARLLQEAHSRAVIPDYVAKLLKVFGNMDWSRANRDGGLPEPLTDREQEIVKLVAAGLTNREIAERLVISAETVKKHVANISDKLGVSNRTEAAARARALNLLD
jgi:LuxR family maltose regulon positive regulatory protein